MSRQTVSIEELRQMLEQGEPVTVLDIRPAVERAEWAIPGSIHVDVYAALKAGDAAALDGVVLPDETPVVTVCGAGKTSVTAAEQLVARGVAALSLEGGMKAWSLAWNTADVPLDSAQARVIQLRRTGKGCLSYLIGSGDEAAVIDPALEPHVYLEVARQQRWRISHVLDTHIHADHLSRGLRLAAASGARYALPPTERVSFARAVVTEGECIAIGAARLRVLPTPGHTPESVSYLLDGRTAFTGDTLFLAAVGRPDLEASAEETERRARQLYHSLRRLLALPPETLILPAHTSQPVPFDGRAIVETLGRVHQGTALLSLTEDDFVQQLLRHIPPTPPNHQRIVHLNENGQWPEEAPGELEAGANRCAIG